MFIQHLSFHRMPQNCIFLHVNSSLKHMISFASSDASSVKTPLSPSSPRIGIEASRFRGVVTASKLSQDGFLALQLFADLTNSARVLFCGRFPPGGFGWLRLGLTEQDVPRSTQGFPFVLSASKNPLHGHFFPPEWNKAKTTTIVGKLKRIVLSRLSVKLCFVMYLRETGWLKDFFLKVSGFMVFQFVGLGWLLFCWLQSASRFAHVRLRICYPWEHQTMWRHRSLIKLYFIF